ncbi:hypothetical protein G7068_13365 [Leucobacter viscericola]|uniref:DUF7507 domain-containing protein n=1 Tax=Leucobacter viscericola TaxID=2714935 RepID=A0A6G7XHN6_9MICO|nr:DUF11 domain-containing protein [Leucobacter viscericola]QIK64075.1 hypothetical protein G7068_13365 [Leucobacter viscericola]
MSNKPSHLSPARERRRSRLRAGLGGSLAVLLGVSLAGAAVPALSAAALSASSATVSGATPLTLAPSTEAPLLAVPSDLPTASYTPEDYSVADEPAPLRDCVPNLLGASGDTSMIPSRDFWLLRGDTMQFKALTTLCAQINNQWNSTPDQLNFSPPASRINWYDPDGDTKGEAVDVGPLCTLTATTGCWDPTFATSLYKVTVTDPVVDSGYYTRQVSGIRAPAGRTGVVQAGLGNTTGSQALRIADPQLKLKKEVCINSGDAGNDGTGAGEGCDPNDDALWVPSQLVAADSTVLWRLTVTNTGNVNLQDVKLATETSSPESNTDSCLAGFQNVDLASGVEFDAGAGEWSEVPNEDGEWPGGETARHVCATEVGKADLTNSAHANATFSEVDLNGNPLVDRFTDPMDNNSHRVGSGVAGATVHTVHADLTLEKFVCASGTGCEPYESDTSAWVKSTSVDRGSDVEWTLVVTNTGNVPLGEVALNSDVLTNENAGNLSDCVVGTKFPSPSGDGLLAVGASTSISCKTQKVANTNKLLPLINTAKVSATPIVTNPDAPGQPFASSLSDEVYSNEDSASVFAELHPALTIQKSASVSTVSKANDVIQYSFLVENTGDVPLSDVKVTDDPAKFTGSGALSAIVCPTTELAVGASFNCLASYRVTQADVDAGSILNVATASGTSPEGDPVDAPESEVIVTAPAAPAISLVKSADRTKFDAAGEKVEYSFVVTNTGNTTLKEITVAETSFTGEPGNLAAVDCPATTLAPGASVTCTATYTTVQADVDRGSVLNTATAEGISPAGAAVVADPSEWKLTAEQNPAASLKKVAYTDELILGETVRYGFRVTNTGNVTLTDVSVSEESFTGNPAFLSEITCPTEPLAPGETVECTANYVVQQADVHSGYLDNTASAKAMPFGMLGAPGLEVKTSPSETTLPGDPRPELELVKTADLSLIKAVGDPIVYTFTVTNTGNVRINDVTVEETSFSGDAKALSALECPTDRVLAPTESLSCTATYAATQADLDSGALKNVAIATGKAPRGDAVESAEAKVTIPTDAKPAISLVKSVDKTSVSKAGESVKYSFAVTNTGNTTFTDLKVVDDAKKFTGTGKLSAVSCPTTKLAPGESVTCTATYEMTQADIDSGSVVNVATANAASPSGIAVTAPESKATVSAKPNAGLAIVKTVDAKVIQSVGQTLNYSFKVTNTGNVTMGNVKVVDDAKQFSGTGKLSAVTCPVTVLAPGESVTCVATYRVTQADLGTESLDNVAFATGLPPRAPGAVISEKSAVVSSNSAVTTPVTPASGNLVVEKQLDGLAAGNAAVQGKVFKIAVTCQAPAENGGPGSVLWSGEVKIKGGQKKLLVDDAGDPWALPGGTRCFAQEIDRGGADVTTIEHDSWENGVVVTAGNPADPQRLQLLVTNTFGPSALALTGYGVSGILILAAIGGAAGLLLMFVRRRRQSA